MKQIALGSAWSLYLLLAAIGCTERTREAPPPDKATIARVLLKAAPTPQHPLDVRWAGTVRLLGYDLSDDKAQPGKPFKVTWYWNVEQPLAPHYRIFTHLSDGKVNRVNLDNERLFRRAYPEATWKKGDYLKDEQEFTLPANWPSSEAVFYLGFYEGEVRMPVTQGKQDGEKRAEALRLPVVKASADKPEPAVPRLIARRATGKIKIDGKLDEPDWRAAQSSGPFVNTMSGEAASFEARAQILYDAENLYFAFAVSDDYLKSEFKQTDDHLWEQDTVEVMLDPDGDTLNYFELQVSPRGAHFDTRYDSPRNPRPFGHVDWDSRVQAKVQLDGTLDDSKSDKGYVAEFAVPYSALAAGATPAAPPAAGASWRINLFVMDAREKDQRAAGWSPPRIGDFHTLDKFGRVVFPEGAAPASASVPASTAH
jgi:hypothetical protein